VSAPSLLDLAGILTAIESHALASGQVQRFTGSALQGNPGAGVTVEATLGAFGPAGGRSGLAATSARVEVRLRLHLPVPATQDGAERGELQAAQALDSLLAVFSADFDLGGPTGGWICWARTAAPWCPPPAMCGSLTSSTACMTWSCP
jgi:hypothetical protein